MAEEDLPEDEDDDEEEGAEDEPISSDMDDGGDEDPGDYDEDGDDAGDDTGDDGGDEAFDNDLDDFSDDFDFDDEDEEGGPGVNKRMIIIGSAVFAGLAVLGGGGYWLFSGEDEEGPKSNIPVVSMELPPRGGGRSLNSLSRSPGGLNALAGKSSAGGLKGAKGQGETVLGRRALSGKGLAGKGLTAKGMAGKEGGRTARSGGALVLPAVAQASFSRLSSPAQVAALSPAPDKALGEVSSHGLLPKIGKDGRKPWQVYARPFKRSAGVASIAIVINGLGLSRASTQAAIDKLPAGVTLAFDPYGSNLERWFAQARQAGHETLISLPLEPVDFPISDPGPYALSSALTAEKNIEKLNFVLGLGAGYVGVLEIMGSRLATSELAFKPVMEAIHKRGMLYLGSRLVRQSKAESLARKLRLPFAEIDLVIDQEVSTRAITAQLTKLEWTARNRSFAVAVAEPYPLTLGQLSTWFASLPGKKLGLAPISALAK